MKESKNQHEAPSAKPAAESVQAEKSSGVLPSPAGALPPPPLNIQAKMQVGSPDDPLEREADKAGDQVVSFLQSMGPVAPPEERNAVTAPAPFLQVIQRQTRPQREKEANTLESTVQEPKPKVFTPEQKASLKPISFPIVQRDANSARALPAALSNIIRGGTWETVPENYTEHPQYYSDKVRNDEGHPLNDILWDIYKALHWEESMGHSPQYWAGQGFAKLEQSRSYIEQHRGDSLDISLLRRNVYAQLGMDSSVEDVLNRFYQGFASIPVTVRWEEGGVQREENVTFTTPYFLMDPRTGNSVERIERAQRNRASEQFRRLGLSQSVLRAVTTRQQMQEVAQQALDAGVIRGREGRTRPNGEDVTHWLRIHGIGVDCSAFVSQALHMVFGEVLGDSSEYSTRRHRRGSAHFRDSPDMIRVSRPDQLRPGDIMHHKGHVRIVSHVDVRQDGVYLTIMESRAGDGRVTEDGEDSIGVDRREWRYPNPDRFQGLEVREGEAFRPIRRRSADFNATFRRHRRLTGEIPERVQAGQGTQGATPSARAASPPEPSGRVSPAVNAQQTAPSTVDLDLTQPETATTHPVEGLEAAQAPTSQASSASLGNLPGRRVVREVGREENRRTVEGWQYLGEGTRSYTIQSTDRLIEFFTQNNFPDLALASQVFKRTRSREGSISAINTYDGLVLTWGLGFSAPWINSHIWPILDESVKSYLISAAPEYFTSSRINVGDRIAIRIDPRVIGALIFVSENEPYREKVFQAQFRGFLRGNLGMDINNIVQGRSMFNQDEAITYWFSQVRHYSTAFEVQRDGLSACQMAGGIINRTNYPLIVAATINILTDNLMNTRSRYVREQNGRFVMPRGGSRSFRGTYIARWNTRMNSFVRANYENRTFPLSGSSIVPAFSSTSSPYLVPAGRSVESIPPGHMTAIKDGDYYDLGPRRR